VPRALGQGLGQVVLFFKSLVFDPLYHWARLAPSQRGHEQYQIIAAAGGISVPVVGLVIPPGLPLEAIRQLSPHLLRSDHAPFWEKNIPAVMWTDTSEFRNPHYHQPTDMPETLDYEFMAEVGKLPLASPRRAERRFSRP
jgi:hypothetical protein